MSNLREAVAVHYGDWVNPNTGDASVAIEDMYVGLEDFRDHLRYEHDLDLVVTRRISPLETQGRPKIVTVHDPVFKRLPDGRSILLNQDWQPDSLDRYPLVIDRDVDRFHGTTDPIAERNARGLDLASKRHGLNTEGMQDLGNHKDVFRLKVTDKLGIATPAYDVNEQGITAFEQAYGDIKSIVKPVGSAVSAGIIIFDSLKELEQARRNGDIKPTDILEPFVNQDLPFEGIEAYRKEDEERLQAMNYDPRHLRELRMHYGAFTDLDGQIHSWAYPTIRFVPLYSKIMGVGSTFIPLRPESLDSNSPIYRKTMEGIRLVLKAANVPQAYGCFDWKYVQMPRGGREYQVGDGNCRSPHMPRNSEPARNAFMNMWGKIARQNITS